MDHEESMHQLAMEIGDYAVDNESGDYKEGYPKYIQVHQEFPSLLGFSYDVDWYTEGLFRSINLLIEDPNDISVSWAFSLQHDDNNGLSIISVEMELRQPDNNKFKSEHPLIFEKLLKYKLMVEIDELEVITKEKHNSTTAILCVVDGIFVKFVEPGEELNILEYCREEDAVF